MRLLKAYLKQTNEFRKVFNKPLLSLENPEDRQKLGRNINGALSPENLSCDGELPFNEIQQRYTYLTGVAEELMRLDPSVHIAEAF